MKKQNRKSYAGAVISAVCLLIYELGLIAVFVFIPGILTWIKVLLCLIPAVICTLIIYVLVQRIREIQSGETDDLDQY